MTVDLAAPLVRSELADSTTRGMLDAMLERLTRTRPGNLQKQKYYDCEAIMPPSKVLPRAWQEYRQVVGWPSTVIDVLEERLDLLGWRGDGTGTLAGLYVDGGIGLESSLTHLDGLLFGTSFIAVDPHAVADGRPDLVTAESALSTTGVWDAHQRRLVAAITVAERDVTTAQPRVVTWADDVETGQLRHVSGVWRWTDRRPHRLGRTPVVQAVNRPRASRLGGRSELSLPVRAYTVQAVQTIAGMSANRDFYAYPQRFAENAPRDMFIDPATGQQIPGHVTAMAAMLASDPPKPGELGVKFGSFAANPPTPFLEQIKGLAMQLAGEAAIPPHYLGLLTDNPASAEAIKNIESRLIKRTERRQTSFGWAWQEVGRLILAAHGVEAQVTPHWRPAETPTVAAEADATVKLVQAGVLPARSGVVYDRLRLTPEDQVRIAADWELYPSPLAGLAAAVNRQVADDGER